MSDERKTLTEQINEVMPSLATLLDNLADGASVKLGEFSDNASPNSEADLHAMLLREWADELRGGAVRVPENVQTVADDTAGSPHFLRKVWVYESGNGHRFMADAETTYDELEEIPAPE